jgi:pimeloyl-ACP methyl ester carboxylesterase
MTARPFLIDIPEARIERIRMQLSGVRWPPSPADSGDGRYGAEPAFMRGLVQHWLEQYDWRVAERELNRMPQRMACIDAVDVHFVHVRGSGRDGLPLLLTHGWPGSFHEFHRIVEPLAHPDRFGGRADDGFDLVIPSLPGFAFSAPPPRPIGLRAVAGLWHRLMTDVLGHERYAVHGGDMGSAVSAWLAHDHPDHVVGLHLNLFTMSTADQAAPQGAEEQAWLQRMQQVREREMAYAALHTTRPLTVALALADNPVGTAAWMVEKFERWSDPGAGLLLPERHDELITAIMVYLVTDAMPTALWLYRGAAEEASGQLPAGEPVRVPTACALFPKEFLPPPPRSRVERSFNVTRWTEFAQGGHFPALEAPAQLVEDLRAFFGPLRGI